MAVSRNYGFALDISDAPSDPPRGDEEWIATDPGFVHGVDLVRYIRSHPDYSDFSIAVAGHFPGIFHQDHC